MNTGRDQNGDGENGLDSPKSEHPERPSSPGQDDHGSAPVDNQAPESTLSAEHSPMAEHEDGTFGSGTQFGDYELGEEIARGGMGVVFRAKHRPLNRIVALKMILSGQLASEEDVKRFFLEAEAAASLDHPGIVPIYEIGQHGGQHFFSMKFIEGGSLANRMDELRKELRQALELLIKVARAVHYAHQRGILHRDLKPANILIDEKGDPLVSDLGLAKHLRGENDVTNTGAILGTPGYMSPEQATGTKDVTTAADIYSLGAILYQFLVGRPPHEGTTPLETVMKVLNENPHRPRDIDDKINLGLELICLKCLEKEANARYSSAAALAEDLENWLAGRPVSVRPPSLGLVFGMWLRDNLRSAGGAVVTGIIAGFALAAVFWMTSMSKPMAATKGIYERFPHEPRPLLAMDVTPPEIESELQLGWILFALIALSSIGLLNVFLVRPSTRTAMIATGVIAGLVASLVAFAISIGWGSVFSSVVEPVRQDLQDISGAAFANTPDETQRGRRALLRRYPDLEQAPAEERGQLVYQKIYTDQLTGIPIGLWLGVGGVLVVGMIPAIFGTLIAGSLLQQKQRFALVIMPYLEIMGTASLACLLLVINTLGWWAGLHSVIFVPPVHYQLPYYASLFLASFAAYRSWNRPRRWVLHVVWIVIGILYFGEMEITKDAHRVVTDYVAQGRLESAAIRLERYTRTRRLDAYALYRAAILRARLGQWNRHADLCGEMIGRFSRTSDPSEADLTAKACLLSPQVVGLEKTFRFVDVVIQEGQGSQLEPWYEFTQGLAAYRIQDYQNVEAHLAFAEQTEAQFFAASAILLKSMTRRQLKRPQEAEQLLQHAHQRFTNALSTEDKDYWEDRLIYEILYEEAKSQPSSTN